MKSGIYIYGIIKTSVPQVFGTIGIGNPASKVYTLGFNDIAAVISACPLTVYDTLGKEQTIKDLIIHQRVIENVMQRFTIIPVKFGTLVETEQAAIAFLSKGYTLLSDELGKMAGKIELDVIASWDSQKIIAMLYQHNAPMQNMQRALVTKGKQATIEDKIALGKLVEQELRDQQSHYHQLIWQTLVENALDTCLHAQANDEMIFNAAFLLDKRNEEHFYQVLAALDQKLENALQFRLVGPLPVYSFSTILLEEIDPLSLEEAKTLLGLSGELTEKTVRDAYHQLAQQYHPDVRREEEADTLAFSRIHAAYKTLKNFVAHGSMHVEVYRWQEEVKSPVLSYS